MILDPISQVLIHENKAARLSAMEFAIVKRLASAGRITRQQLFDSGVHGTYGSMSITIGRMREKLQRIGLDISLKRKQGVALVSARQAALD